MNKAIVEGLFKAVAVAALVGVVVLFFTGRDSTLVYVDAVKLVNGYKGMEQAKQEYAAVTAGYQKNVDSLTAELQAEVTAYETKQAKMTAAEKALTEKMLQAKQDQLLTYQQAVAEKIQQADQTITGKVVERVNNYVRRYGEEHGYAMILAATQYGNIVYTEEGRDITDAVLAGLNHEFDNP